MGPDVQLPTAKCRRLPRDHRVWSLRDLQDGRCGYACPDRPMHLGLGHRALVHQPLVVPNIAGDGTATNAHPHSISIVSDWLMEACLALGGF